MRKGVKKPIVGQKREMMATGPRIRKIEAKVEEPSKGNRIKWNLNVLKEDNQAALRQMNMRKGLLRTLEKFLMPIKIGYSLKIVAVLISQMHVR